jgi:hypothetical protein
MVMTHFLRIGNAETKVEIGSFVGKSANFMETEMKASGAGLRVLSR